MIGELTAAQYLKFNLLAEGAAITESAEHALNDIVGGGQWSPADYASTKGLIVRLDDNVWVNMPVARYNPSLVSGTSMVFDHGRDGFVVRGQGLESAAAFWPPPRYLGGTASNGNPMKWYVVGHGDRVRLSPTIGCAMVCDFCNIPFDDTYAGLKPIDVMLDAVRTALADDLQPPRHMLISGGTPGPAHVPGLKHIYERVLEEFPGLGVDIMMVPVEGLFDLARLDALGLDEISVNLEIYDEAIAASVMRHKHRQGRAYYLDFIEHAAEILGPHRVRSMLMVGLESAESTLEGVQAILDRGGVPVLSSFVPDPVTPMASRRPPTAAQTRDLYLRANDLAHRSGGRLGPDCGPCTHNTLNFAEVGPERPDNEPHTSPVLHSGV